MLCPPPHAVPALGAHSISWEGTHDTEHRIPLAQTPGLCAEHALVASCVLNPLGSLAEIPGAGWGPVPWMVSVLFLLGAGITAIQGQPHKGDTAALIGVVLPSLGCAPGVTVPSSSAGPRGDPQPASGAELLCSPQGPCRSHYIIVISRARHSAWFSHKPSHPLHCDSFAPGECQLSFSGASGRWAASCPLSTPFSIHPPLEHPPPRGMRCELSVPEVGCVSHDLAPAQHPSVLSSLSHSSVCHCVCCVHAACPPSCPTPPEGCRGAQGVPGPSSAVAGCCNVLLAGLAAG